MKIGCQTIIFGNERHKDNIESIFKTVSETGYAGVEIGFARLDAAKAMEYAALLDKYSLEMAAVHIGGNYNDEESVKKQMANIPEVIKLAKTLKSKNIFISGRRMKEADEFKIAAENINKLGKFIRDEGLTLSYHNHSWEIENDMLGLNITEQYTEKENLSFVPDVGWVTRGGSCPSALIKKLYDRIVHVHFKEFTADNKFTELGTGVVDFKGVYETMLPKKDFWIVSEQDQTTIGAEASVKANMEYMKVLLG